MDDTELGRILDGMVREERYYAAIWFGSAGSDMNSLVKEERNYAAMMCAGILGLRKLYNDYMEGGNCDAARKCAEILEDPTRLNLAKGHMKKRESP